MPLSVPLLLVPGEPDRHYTVHTQRARWDDAKLAEHGTRGVSALMEAACEGMRYVSECIAAELADADVAVIHHPDGSAEAVARVLCDSEACAAAAERYHRDADEDIEAEAARKWAATKLQDQTVELLKLRGELEKTTPGKTPASVKDMLASVLAVQQERTGGSTDRVVLMLDEAAYLARESGLLADGTPEDAREQIEQLIRTGRKPYPTERRYGKTPDAAFMAAEEEQSVATRDDLPAYGELARAAHYLERGELRVGLKDVAEVLEELAHLVGEVAADYAEHDEDGSALRVESKRITHAAERVSKLADTVEEVAE